MTHIMIDKNNYEYGNFKKETEKKFVYVGNSFFEIYSEKDTAGLPGKKNTLDLTGDRVKVLIEASPAAFHYITGVYGSIANALEIFENPLLIINTSKIRSPFCSQKLISFLYYFLEDNNIDYICIDSEDSTRMIVDNFYRFPFGDYPIPNAINKIHEMFLKYVDNRDVVPNKKVYISRKKVNTGLPAYDVPDKNYLIRVDNEEAIENFFKTNGFEVVYPEDFKSLKEQINYFYDVKTAVLISGGGAINLIFMQNGGNCIELVTPLFSVYGEVKEMKDTELGNWVISHHNFISNISFKRDLDYIGLSNFEKKSDIILNKIIKNKSAMCLIGEEINE